MFFVNMRNEKSINALDMPILCIYFFSISQITCSSCFLCVHFLLIPPIHDVVFFFSFESHKLYSFPQNVMHFYPDFEIHFFLVLMTMRRNLECSINQNKKKNNENLSFFLEMRLCPGPIELISF